MKLIKTILQSLLRFLYKVEVKGIDNYKQAGDRVLVIANHASFLDAILLAVFLPEKLTFAVNTQISRAWWVKPVLSLVTFFPMDPTNPLSTKSLIKYMRDDKKAVIFPEGRITVTGSLMKTYQGPGLVADRSQSTLLPVRIDGAQYTPFSRLRGIVRLRWFPKITLHILPPRKIEIPQDVTGRERRNIAGKQLSDMMTEMIFNTSDFQQTLFDALLDARKTYGGSHIIAEDIQRKPINYDQLILRSFVLGQKLSEETSEGEYVGLLLPGTINTVIAFIGLQAFGRVPAMLNYSTGVQGLVSACETGKLKIVYTSRRFLSMAGLEDAATTLNEKLKLVYLDDLVNQIGLIDKAKGFFRSIFSESSYCRNSKQSASDPAVILFTSGSEGVPKGVVLSHANLLANRAQLAARVDFSAQDIILNVLPLFHSFGLTAGTLLPLFSGIRVFFYPSPLHYRIVPEIAYDVNATILFGTNTFLSGYARHAHPYDFYSIRYVFAGAEKLKDDTRQIWAEKFGIRIFEGYGATETSPALTTNTPMNYKAGSVGRLLPGIEHRIQPVTGIDAGGRLYVRGPNVMLGYLLHDEPGIIKPTVSELGEKWYDTGDIVEIDKEGFLTICGRVKRFAKVGGEMVSLSAVEMLTGLLWPEASHAVVSIADSQKGEQLVLVTTKENATRKTLLAHAKNNGVGEISIPRKIISINKLPLLGSGKIDYKAVQQIVEEDQGL
ncbi:MAG: AMP-binding protein [Gammaproteobacteria bacterium]